MKGNRFIRRNLPVILTVLGTIGVVATAILTAEKAPQAKEILEEHEEDAIQDKVVAVAPTYILPVVVGAGTIACIISAQVINQRRIGRLAASYAALGGLYTKYREKVKEVLGIEKEKLVNASARKEMSDFLNEGKRWYKDSITGKCWETTPEKLLQAQLDINEEFATTGSACLSDLLKAAGAPKDIWNSRVAQYSMWDVEDTAANDVYFLRMSTVESDDFTQGHRVNEILYDIDPLLYTGDIDEVYSTLGYC